MSVPQLKRHSPHWGRSSSKVKYRRDLRTQGAHTWTPRLDVTCDVFCFPEKQALLIMKRVEGQNEARINPAPQRQA